MASGQTSALRKLTVWLTGRCLLADVARMDGLGRQEPDLFLPLAGRSEAIVPERKSFDLLVDSKIEEILSHEGAGLTANSSKQEQPIADINNGIKPA